MKKIKLKEICDFNEGYVNPSQTNSEYFNGPIKWIRANDINFNKINKTSRTLSQIGFDSAGKSAILFPPNSIAITKSGTIGRVGLIQDYMCGNRAVINITLKSFSETTLKYLFYQLSHKTELLNTLAVGSVQKNLYISALCNLEIDYLDHSSQQHIVDIIGSIDDKIENNDKIIEKLEMLSSLIFKNSFNDLTRYDPKKISDFSKKIITGTTPPTKDEIYWDGDYNFVTIPDMQNGLYILDTERKITENAFKKFPSRVIESNSLVVSCIATIGLLGINHSKSITNQQINSIEFNNNYELYFTHQYLKSSQKELIQLGSGGSTTLNINKQVFSDILINVPNDEKLNLFGETVEPFYRKILSMQIENNKLRILKRLYLNKFFN